MNPNPLKILFVASEAVPFAKTGGLADVAGALPVELAQLGHDVRLVMPRYGSLEGRPALQEWARLDVPTATGVIPAIVEEGRLPGSPVPVLMVRYDPFFDRPGLYQSDGKDYPDNLERFAFFCRAVMELLPRLRERASWRPDLLHAHDWQTALAVVYPRSLYAGHPDIAGLRTLFTVHNLGYQGLFPGSDYWKTGLGPELFTPGTLEFYGKVNLLKGGLLFADYLNTVSVTYSQEIQTPEFGNGLEGVLAMRRDRLAGVVNGIDTGLWDPATDPHLAHHYSVSDLTGKKACKTALQRELKLPVRKVPLLAIVSRLTGQKGLDLVAEIIPELMVLDLQLVLLGTGDPEYEARFRSLQERYPDKLGLRIGFDEGLAHRMEAGADLFLMPSRYEPCGLNQQYSLRYGTVPVVRKTGGLADTVVPYTPLTIREGRATGFMFHEPTAEALLCTVLLALRVFKDKAQWASLIQAGMATDVSWRKSARLYSDLYGRVLGK
jgi:starch synthase